MMKFKYVVDKQDINSLGPICVGKLTIIGSDDG